MTDNDALRQKHPGLRLTRPRGFPFAVTTPKNLPENRQQTPTVDYLM